MAKIGDIEIANSQSQFDSGAAFLLRQESPASVQVDVGSHSTVEISSDNPFVVTRTKGCSDAEDAYITGHEIVQQGLDFLSITGKADLATRDALDERIVWWRKDDKQILRCVTTITSKWDTSVRMTVGGSSPAKQVKPTMPKYHKAFRYFRLSQVTEDLFNAYRNMYLAFELLLSNHTPKSDEREIDWLERGLGTLDSTVLPKVFRGESDPVQAIIDTIYKDARLPLFHAKDGRDYYEPYGAPSERKAVASALIKLTELVLNLARFITGKARGMGGRKSSSLKMRTATSVFSDAYFIFSDDKSPYDRTSSDLSHSRYTEALRLETFISPDLVRDDHPVLIGRAEVNTAIGLQQINRIEIINNTSPLVDHLLPSPLVPVGIDVIECQLNMRDLSARAPKQIFPSG